jgi:ligand-binding sensor domain-containing protein
VYDGLPQSQLSYITQDSTGYIWVATKGGVARFDGFQFESFTEKDGLCSNFVMRIMPTDSCIWFFSSNGITKFKDDKFTPYKFDGKPIVFAGMFNNRIILFEQQGQNLIFDGQQFQFFNFNNLFPQDTIVSFLSTIGKDSLLVLDCKSRLKLVTHGKPMFIDSCVGYSLYPKAKKVMYNKLTDNGIYTFLYDYAVGKIGPCNLGLVQKIGGYWSSGMVSNSKVVVWDMNYVAMLEEDKVHYIKKKFNLLTWVFIDNQNNYWIADEDGLYFFNKLEFIEYTQQNSDIIPSVWDVKEFPKGTYYFASYTNGLQKYKNGAFLLFNTFVNSYGAYQKMFYFNTPPASDTSIILNHSEGVVSYNGKTFQQLIKEITYPFAGLATFYDSLNKRWFAGGSAEKLYVRESNQTTRLFFGSDSTYTRNILDICYDKDNRICLGHRGISRFDNGKFTPYPHIPDTMTWRVFSLKKDYMGNLWIGTDQGLWFYNYDTIFQINTTYFKGYVTFLESIDSTWLMGGTTLGLALLYLPDFYKNGTQQVKYYDRYNGFTGRDCGQNGTLHDSENMFWIPTIDRVIKLDPTKIAFNTHPPVPIIKGISLLGKNLGWTFLGDSVHRFRYDQNGIKFSFVGLNYSAPERVRYKYRLIGFGDTWSNETDVREAIFTNLDPGKYTFELLACNEDGYWTENPATYSFEIVPAWWQRLSVQIGFALFLAGILTWSIVFIMKRRAAQQREKLETRNRMLNMSLSTIKNQMDPHFTYNALNGIESLIMKEDRATAYQYLLKLSGLIRNTLKDNDLMNRTLEEELSFVTSYLELEKFRFKEKFTFNIKVDPAVDLQCPIPKLLIQIFVENAIKHGLMHKEGEGILDISLELQGKEYKINIKDNGIGREMAKKFAIHSTGKGLNIIRKLIRIYNEQNNSDIDFQIVDLFDNENNSIGTRVEIVIPMKA